MTTLASTLDRPLFLVGTTRSGTTLLSLMLGHHSQIAFVGELEWAFDVPDEVPLDAYRAQLEVDRFVHWHKLRIDRSLGRHDLVQSFLAQMYESTGKGRPVVGTQVHRHFARVLRTWPNARFIHIVRDGRDVAASWIKFGWHGNTWACAREWRELVQQWQAVAPSIDPKSRVELRFEELIADPEGSLRRLCDFLELPYEPGMLRYHEDTTYDPIDKGQAGKWRKTLSAFEVRVFEAIAGDVLAAQGYAQSGYPALPRVALLSPMLRAQDGLRKHRTRIERFGAPLWLAEQVTRRARLRPLHDRVQLRMNEVVNRNLK